VLTAVSIVVAALLALPLGYLVVQALHYGWSQLQPVLFRHLTAVLLENTVLLTLIVTLAAGIIGAAVAWLVERTDLPGRRVFAVVAILPIAVPRFVLGSEWASVFPQVQGLWGAAMVMSLALYPLVYLPVSANLRSADPAMEEMARSLGLSRTAAWGRVTLRQIKPALLGGCLLVALATLAEYGAFEALRFQTFTTEIFSEFTDAFDTSAACALSLVLVAIGLILICGEAVAAGPRRLARAGAQAPRPAARHHLGPWTVPAVCGLSTVVILALGVPAGTIVYWMVENQTSTLPAASSLASSTLHSVAYGAIAAAMATALALPVAWSAVRHRSPLNVAIERGTFFVQGLPGLVIGLSLVYLAVRYAFVIYQRWELLVLAYAIMFFPLSLVALRASIISSPVGLEEVGASLGRNRFVVAARVTVPLLRPGLAAAFCLVFISVITELTATLLLIPTGASTLATQFWSFQSEASNSAAAPYAALMMGLAIVPGFVVARWFHRLPDRATTAIGLARPPMEGSELPGSGIDVDGATSGHPADDRPVAPIDRNPGGGRSH
jgi:iron(III) transport system permease protein